MRLRGGFLLIILAWPAPGFIASFPGFLREPRQPRGLRGLAAKFFYVILITFIARKLLDHVNIFGQQVLTGVCYRRMRHWVTAATQSTSDTRKTDGEDRPVGLIRKQGGTFG